MDSPSPSAAPAAFSQRDMAAIVRRHAHDVRNYINCIDLEAALLEEVVTDPEALDSVRRMRSQLTQLEATILALSIKFAEPQLVTISAADLLHLWKNQMMNAEDVGQRIEWSSEATAIALTIDPQAITSVLRELLMRAAKRTTGSLKASVQASADAVQAEVRHPAYPAPATDDWVAELERIVARNGGTLRRHQLPDQGECVTTVSFPSAH